MATEERLPETSAAVLRSRLATGVLSAVDLAKACLARIDAREDEVRAWAWYDRQCALYDAERLDDLRLSGVPLGPLHGLPVGVKDIIDTRGIPTENGCSLDSDRIPGDDAEIVSRLKAAGALIIGKTVTTELAFLHPGKTRNPCNLAHTPGGSSSGSAAAVADGMVPLAVGTQTGGSVVRPASFCGVVGFKPSFGAIPQRGVLIQSPSLDTIGVFARDPVGAALLADVLMGTGSIKTPLAELVRPPSFAVVYPPGWDLADPDLARAFDAFCDGLGDQAQRAPLPAVFSEAAAQRARINAADMAYHYARYMDAGGSHLGPETRAAITQGRALSAPDYLAARAYQAALPSALVPLFADCDALLCPAAPGPAPKGLESTGDSIFNGLWTMAGTPAVTLPLLASPSGLPMGVQLIAAPGADQRLMQVADWLWKASGRDGGVPS